MNKIKPKYDIGDIIFDTETVDQGELFGLRIKTIVITENNISYKAKGIFHELAGLVPKNTDIDYYYETDFNESDILSLDEAKSRIVNLLLAKAERVRNFKIPAEASDE